MDKRTSYKQVGDYLRIRHIDWTNDKQPIWLWKCKCGKMITRTVDGLGAAECNHLDKTTV